MANGRSDAIPAPSTASAGTVVDEFALVALGKLVVLKDDLVSVTVLIVVVLIVVVKREVIVLV